MAVHRRKARHIKQPLNAFMLFLKEKRKLPSPEILQKGNRVVNAHLGRMVSVFQLPAHQYYKMNPAIFLH